MDLTCRGEALMARLMANEAAATLPVSMTYIAVAVSMHTLLLHGSTQALVEICIPLVQCQMISAVPLAKSLCFLPPSAEMTAK